MKRNMNRRVEGVSPLVAKEDAEPKRVKFSSLDTIHTFADKSVPSPHISVGKPISQRTEKPKTSEYMYFKKLMTFDNQNLTCLQSSKSQNEHEGLVAYKHFSGDSHSQEKGHLSLMATSSCHCNINSTSDSMRSQFQTDFKKVHNYGKVFHSKRKKLQDLAAKSLSIEKGDLILYGSKTIMNLLQRLKFPNNSIIGTASHEEDLECSDISIGIENKPILSNFHPEMSISPGLKYDFQKSCAPFDVLNNAEGLRRTYHGNKLLKIETSNFQHEDYLSLISSLEADKVHHYDNDGYEYSLHGLAAVDLGIHSLCTKQQMTRGVGIDYENILDTKFLHFPSTFSRMCSNDYDCQWSLKEFPLSTDILQPNRHCVFDSLPMKRDEQGLKQWYDINYKSQKFSHMKGFNMQLPDHIDSFRCHMQDFYPETGMILWTSPGNNICLSPPLEHEDKHKYNEKESASGNSVVLWDSSYKDIQNCDKIEDIYFQGASQNFSFPPSLWDHDLDYAGPGLGYMFPSRQLQHGIDSWERKESFSCYLSSGLNLPEVQHKLLNNTDEMHMNEQYSFAQVQGPGVSGFISFPYRMRESTDSPVKLHLELENEVNIPDNGVNRGEEQECSEVFIYPVDSCYGSYGAEHVGLNTCTDFSLQSVWKTVEKEHNKFCSPNGTNCLIIDNHLSHLSDETCNIEGQTLLFNSFQFEN